MKKMILLWGPLVAITLVVAITAVMGVRSMLARTASDEGPELIEVSVYRGAGSAEITERELLVPLEEAVAPVLGVVSIASEAYDGDAVLTLGLDPERRSAQISQDLRDRLEKVSQRLSLGEDELTRTSRRVSEPTLWVKVSGPHPSWALGDFAYHHLQALLREKVKGLGWVEVVGLPTRELLIRVDPRRLEERGITLPDVVEALQRKHVRSPEDYSSMPDEAEELIPEALLEPLDLEKLSRVVVGRKSGAKISLSDVAVLEDAPGEPNVWREWNAPVHGLRLHRDWGISSELLVERVKAALDAARPDLPPGLQLEVLPEVPTEEPVLRGVHVEFSVRGADWEQLLELSAELQRKLVATGRTVAVTTDVRPPTWRFNLVPNPGRLSQHGVAPEEVASIIKALERGLHVGSYPVGGRNVEVMIRVVRGEQDRVEELLKQLAVRSDSGEWVPLGSVVTVSERPPWRSITRRDRERAITLLATWRPGLESAEALAEVEHLRTELPQGTHLVIHRHTSRAALP
jgi:multidrug efflux pump subunit AcrB